METSRPEPRKNHSFEWPFFEKANPAALIAIPVLILLMQTVPHLSRGYAADEVFSIVASRSLSGLFKMFRELENNMSLFQVILYFWIRAFGESEVATHSLSLLAAVITVPVFFRLERLWLNKTISFFGILLLSVSPWFLHQSVETRSYAMLILSATVSTLLYARFLIKPGNRLAVLYGLSIGAGVYIHYFAVLVPLAHLFTFTAKTFTKTTFLPLLLAVLLAGVVVSPLVLFPPQNKSQVAWMFAPDAITLWYVFSAFTGGGFGVVVVAGCFLLALVSHRWKAGAQWKFEPEKLSAAWAIVPILLIWVFSRYVKPIFITRFFVWVIPGVVLLFTLIVSYAGKNRWLKTAVFCVLTGLFALKAVLLFRRVGPEGYRSAVAYLNSEVKAGER